VTVTVTLVEVLRDETRRRAVVRDGVQVIDDEVASRGGLSGLALKAGYRAVQAVQPNMVAAALGMLLPEFAPVLDPFYAAGRAEGDVERHFRTHATAIADALLAVTDRRAKASSNAVVKKAYGALRGTAQREVAASVPRLAILIRRHVSEGAP